MSTQTELLMLKGMISDLPADQQEFIKATKAKILQIIMGNSEVGMIALALVGLELAVEGICNAKL